MGPDDVTVVLRVDKLKARISQPIQDLIHIRINTDIGVTLKPRKVYLQIGQTLVDLVLLQN